MWVYVAWELRSRWGWWLPCLTGAKWVLAVEKEYIHHQVIGFFLLLSFFLTCWTYSQIGFLHHLTQPVNQQTRPHRALGWVSSSLVGGIAYVWYVCILPLFEGQVNGPTNLNLTHSPLLFCFVRWLWRWEEGFECFLFLSSFLQCLWKTYSLSVVCRDTNSKVGR